MAESIDRLASEPRPEFGDLFERYSRPISAFFARRGCSREDCLELTQETFLGVHQGIERFRSGTDVEVWLFTIAANVWRNEVRSRVAAKRKGQNISLEKLAEEGKETGRSSRPDPLNDVLHKERQGLVHDAIRELPDQMRECLLLRIQQELKYREIATVMQISTNTVKSQLFQAKEKLQEKLSELENRARDAAQESKRSHDG